MIAIMAAGTILLAVGTAALAMTRTVYPERYPTATRLGAAFITGIVLAGVLLKARLG